MKLPRRTFLHLAVGAAALPAIPRLAWAQAYPTRPVRWIIPFPPGGGADIVSRIMGSWLSDRLGQPIIIESKPGGGTNIGTQTVVNSPPDGYTLLFFGSSAAINATFYATLPFNLQRDIAPVAGLVDFPLALVAHPSVPAQTVVELIAYAKAHPGKISMGSFGTGTVSHVAGELFKMMTGVNLVHVPYRGSAPMVIDLLSGQVQVAFDVLTTSLPHIRSGALVRWPWRAKLGSIRYRMSRRSAMPCQGTRRVYGSGSACQGVRHPRSSSGSTARSMLGW
jgi:tripartite-type tricarboxylate transporter receptor subunit TctC